MRIVTFHDTERVTHTDLNSIPFHVFKFLHDSFSQSFYAGAEGFIGGSFAPSRASASSISLAKGLGYQADASPTGDQVDYGPLVNVAAATVAAPAAPSGGNRYDLYEVQLKKDAVFVTETRDYRASANDPITTATTNKVNGYSYVGQWVSGSLGGGVPSGTAGWLTVATVLQTDGVGIAAAGDVTDARTLLGLQFSQAQFVGVANNQAVAADVTGLLLDSATQRAVKIVGQISINATASLFAGFEAMAYWNGSAWRLAVDEFADTPTGVELTITAAGQIQYTSDNYAGFSSGAIKWRLFDIGV